MQQGSEHGWLGVEYDSMPTADEVELMRIYRSLDETKQAADYVTGSVDDGGIAQALRHFGVL